MAEIQIIEGNVEGWKMYKVGKVQTKGGLGYVGKWIWIGKNILLLS